VSYPLGAADFLRSAPLGIRVVARYRIAGGFTDALGYLRSSDEASCVIDTRRGEVVISVADVVAAKQVPEPPARRSAVARVSPTTTAATEPPSHPAAPA